MFRGPPSTPGRDHYYDYDRQPSTTPAGPPPPDESHYPSSTPAGPPPGMNNGLFGNTRPTFNPNSHGYSTNSLFDSSPPKQGLFEGIGAGSIGTSTSGRPPVQRGRITSSHFQAPTNALNRDAHGESDEEYTDEEEDEDDQDMDHDEGTDEDEPLSPQRHNKTQNRFSQSVVSRTSATDMEPGLVLVRSGAKQTKFDLLALARGLTSDAPQGRWMPTGKQKVLNEGDHLILETERLAEKVHESLHSDSPDKRTEVLGTVAQELVAVWKEETKPPSRPPAISDNRTPWEKLKGSKLASLLLTLHHPPQIGLNQRASALSLVPARTDSRQYTPIPRVLLDWLNYAFPLDGNSEVGQVGKETNGYSRHPSFWEAIHVSIVRGNFSQTMKFLQGARLENAETAERDGLGTTGYSGTHLQYANHAVRHQAIVHAYRHLYRHSLRAIQFSKPARYTLRDRIRLAFRKGSAADYEPQRIRNTLEFLQYATKESGLEHKIVKNLMFVWHVQDTGGRLKHIPKNLTRDEIEIKTTAYDTFNHNIRMLNESMGLCLPAMTVRDPS